MDSKIIIYGTSWCWSSKRARGIFDKNNIEYEWIDIDENEEAAQKGNGAQSGISQRTHDRVSGWILPDRAFGY